MANKDWQAWVWVRWKAGTPATAWETWKNNAQIAGAWSTLGEWDCVLAVKATDPDQLEEFVWKNLRANQWVDATRTTFVKQWW